MSSHDWNNRHFLDDATQTRGTQFAKQARARSEKFKKETAKWEKGNLARFSNGVIGKVTKVNATSLEIRIGLGRSQKYSPKMVTKFIPQAKSRT